MSPINSEQRGKGFGKFTLLPGEEEAIRERARAAGEDPDVAVRKEKERMQTATERLNYERQSL